MIFSLRVLLCVTAVVVICTLPIPQALVTPMGHSTHKPQAGSLRQATVLILNVDTLINLRTHTHKQKGKLFSFCLN